MRNFYKVLGITEDASPKEIRDAYHRLVRQWHPDLNPHDPLAHDMMKMYNDAYAVLSDPEKRAGYDLSIGVRSDSAGRADNETRNHRAHDGSAPHVHAHEPKTHEPFSRGHGSEGNVDLDAIFRMYEQGTATRGRSHPIVMKNFIVSVWLLMGYCVIQMITYLLHASEIIQAYFPFDSRIIAFPLVVGFMEYLFWLRFFRDRDRGSRLFAGFMGIMLFLKAVLVPLIVVNLYDWQLSTPGVMDLLFYLYVSTSHVGFAFFGREY
jgi:hypothetical protein